MQFRDHVRQSRRHDSLIERRQDRNQGYRRERRDEFGTALHPLSFRVRGHRVSTAP
jgi:hypothetical protein